MKPILLLLVLALSILGCKESEPRKTYKIALADNKPIVISSVEVLKEVLVLNGNKGKWYYKEKPFNGYSLKYYPNGTLEEKWGFYNGKREGIAKRWTQNGTLQIESYYKNNRLTGEYKTWWENDTLASLSYYEDGAKEGEDKQWYSNRSNS